MKKCNPNTVLLNFSSPIILSWLTQLANRFTGSTWVAETSMLKTTHSHLHRKPCSVSLRKSCNAIRLLFLLNFTAGMMDLLNINSLLCDRIPPHSSWWL